MVGAIAGSTKREPITVGKPAEFMLDNIAKTFNLQRNQICMVGDRLDTDILFGKNGGLTTCLVLSGEALLPGEGGGRGRHEQCSQHLDRMANVVCMNEGCVAGVMFGRGCTLVLTKG
jgi:histidinol phosphatase-like enzyme